MKKYTQIPNVKLAQNNILNESFIYDFKDIKEREWNYIYNWVKHTQIKYPDFDPNLEESYHYQSTRYDWKRGSLFEFIKQKALQKQIIINNKESVKPGAKKVPHKCYYNALNYLIKFGSQYEDIELAFGYMVYQNELDKFIRQSENDFYKESKYSFDGITSLACFEHAFLVVDHEKILDPSIDNGNYYFYEIVPEEDWSKFNLRNSDTICEDFGGKYCAKKMEQKYSDNFEKEFKDFLIKTNKTIS